MDGQGILKLRKPMKDNPQNLYFENYELLHCEYSFDKGITKEGKVRTEVLAGNIRVALPMLPTAELLTWAFDRSKKYNGEIIVHDAHEESVDKIYFEEGRLVGFRMHYEPNEDKENVILLLSINAQRMIIGDVEYINRWN